MYTHGRVIAAALLGLLGGCATFPQDARLRDELLGSRQWRDAEELRELLAAERPGDEVERELAERVDLRRVEQIVLTRNPDAASALERWAEGMARPLQSAALPDPRVTYRYSSMFRMHVAEVMQEVPFPSKLIADASIATSQAYAARYDFLAAMNRLVERAQVSVAALQIARRTLELVDANLAQLERFVELARTKYTTGAVSQSDVLRAELEREGLRSVREGFRNEETIAASALNLLLARRPNAPLGAIAAIASPVEPAPLASLLALAEQSHPDLASARWRTEASGAGRERAALDGFPDLVFSAAYVRDFEDDDDEVEASVGFSLPVWVWKTWARKREAAAAQRRANAEQLALRNRILDEVAQAESRLRAALAQGRILREQALPTAERNVAVTEAAYVSGTLDLLPVIDARRQLLAQRLELVRVEGEALVAEAALRRATGGGAEEGAR